MKRLNMQNQYLFYQYKNHLLKATHILHKCKNSADLSNISKTIQPNKMIAFTNLSQGLLSGGWDSSSKNFLTFTCERI